MKRLGVLGLGLLGILVVYWPVAVAAPTKPDGTARSTASPWGGSPLGPDGAFEAPDRARVLQIDTVMRDLGIKTGSVVADIGAGGGWFTMLAARRVGPTGVVYAEEIEPRFVRFIADRAQKEKLRNVRAVLGTYTDPRLPANTMDAVLILNAYHEFDQPLAMLRKIRAAMKVGGLLGFIERDTPLLRREAREAYARTGKIKRRVDEQPDKNPRTDDHRLAREIVIREAAAVGLKHRFTRQLGQDNYLVVVVREN